MSLKRIPLPVFHCAISFCKLWSVFYILSVNYEVFITSFLWIVPDIKLTACHLLYLSMNYEVFLTSSWQHIIVLSLSMNTKVFLASFPWTMKCSWHQIDIMSLGYIFLDPRLTYHCTNLSWTVKCSWHQVDNVSLCYIFLQLWSVLSIKLTTCHCVISLYEL